MEQIVKRFLQNFVELAKAPANRLIEDGAYSRIAARKFRMSNLDIHKNLIFGAPRKYDKTRRKYMVK